MAKILEFRANNETMHYLFKLLIFLLKNYNLGLLFFMKLHFVLLQKKKKTYIWINRKRKIE